MSLSPRPCPVCRIGTMLPSKTTYTAPSHAGFVDMLVIEHVPALVCDTCGDVAFSASVAAVIERLVYSNVPPAAFPSAHSVRAASISFADAEDVLTR